MNSKHERIEGFIESKEVKLQYLDWGGQGPFLILLCGAGDTPFLFDSLANKLSTNFHVIGYSRRNHGKSKAADEKYDNGTLVSDLKLLLDSLNISKANLLGWSLGGNEITEFAVRNPHRVNKLIYLEAGYDLSDGGFERLLNNIPRPYLPDNLVMKSVDNYRDWYHHFWFGDMEWNAALEANLQASVRVNEDSSIETIPNDRIFKSILKEAMNYRRPYESVLAPSLIIYTEPFLFPANRNPETIRLYDSIENNLVSSWRASNKIRIKSELRNSIIIDAPLGSHTSLLFLSSDFLVNTINSFLNIKG